MGGLTSRPVRYASEIFAAERRLKSLATDEQAEGGSGT